VRGEGLSTLQSDQRLGARGKPSKTVKRWKNGASSTTLDPARRRASVRSRRLSGVSHGPRASAATALGPGPQ